MVEGKINEDFFDKVGSIRKGAVKIDLPEQFKIPRFVDVKKSLVDYSERIRQEKDLQNIRYKIN